MFANLKGKNMFGIIHFYTEEIAELGNLTSLNKKEYAEKHGYKYIEINSKEHLDLSKSLKHSKFKNTSVINFGWCKIALLKKILLENQDVEWFFWIDADAVFMNYFKKLEQFVSEKAFFIVGRDCNGINVGTFFIKNCQRSIDFLDDVWKYGPRCGKNWWTETEQGAIDHFSLKEKYFDGFWTVENHLFNSYVHECSSCGSGVLPCDMYESGDFVIHLPGVKEKIDVLKIVLNHVIK